MKVPMVSTLRPLVAFAVAGSLLVVGCKRHDGDKHAQPGPVNTAPRGDVPPQPTERVGSLEQDMQVQPARSTSDARLPLPWQDITPTANPDAGSVAPARVWPGPAVLIGRGQVWLNGKAIAPVHCTSKKPEACTADATAHPSTVAQFGFEPGQIAEGKLQALVDLAAGFKDKDVPVIADRRVNWQAVEAVMAALRAAGAKPQLATGSMDGELVDALGIGTALPDAPTLIAARRAAEPGESVPGGLPSDATALTVLISASGVSVEIGRAQGEPAYPEVMGNIVESLIALAERMRLAAPKITSVTIRVDPDVPMEQVIQVIDGLRDDCGRTNRGQRCTARSKLYTSIQVQMAGPAAEATKIGLDAPLHLDAAAPSGLHLADTPEPSAKPLAPGLHL